METNVYFSAVESERIDAATGTLYGVSVMTIGPAKGHGVLVDATTLEQVKACIEAFKGGCKVKANHWGGVESIIGLCKNPRIKGDKLKADLQLLTTHPQYETLLALCRDMPESIGLSVSFSGTDEMLGGFQTARCTEVYSVDLVDQPAANPGGLFQAKQQTASNNMSDNNNQVAELQTQVKQLSAQLSDLLKAQQKPEDKKLGDITVGELRALIVDETAKQFAKVATPPAPAPAPAPASTPNAPAAAAPAAPVKKDFAALVAEQVTAGKSKSQAVRHCIAQHPEEYRAWTEAGNTRTL